MRHTIAVVTCMWVALAAGCGGSNGGTSPTNDATTSDTAASADSTDDTSQPGVDRCTSNDDCTAAGAICACDGACVVPTGTPCTEDRNCGTPRWCNPCTNHCEEQGELCDPCTEARGCRDQGACLPYAAGGSFCGLACLSDAGCPRGYRCAEVDGIATMQCVARSGACESLAVCSRDEDCPVGRICQAQTGQCIEGCVDGGCPNDDVCVAGRCSPPCSTNGDCVAPAVCEESGKCRDPGTCSERTHCPEPETYCDRPSGQCVAGCQDDLDCKDAAKRCDDGACVAKGCQHNYQCAFGQVCNKATGACQAYPANEPYCAVCDASSEQNPSCPEPNLCVTFQDDEGQALGDHCLVPCKDDPVDGCPQGWQCQRLEDPNGGEPRFVCARPCYITPVGLP